MAKTWRDIARPIIEKVIANHSGDEKALKKALLDAYPFGERKYHPYKIWLDEIKRQTGTKKQKPVVKNEDQLSLF